MAAPLRIIGYTRLSRAADDSTSIARQRAVIEETCAARGLALLEITEDTDMSGTKPRAQRPGLDAALTAVETGRADAIMVWRLDRICRSVAQFSAMLDDGIHLISATEAEIDSTNPQSRAMAEITQVFAQLEARVTGLRAVASHAYLRRVGRWPGGVVPYGYRVIDHPGGAGKALEPDPVEAAVVRRMADAALAGETTYGIAKALNADGIRTSKGKQWQPTTVHRILTADATLGRSVESVVIGKDADGKDVKERRPVRGDDGMPLTPWTPLLTVDEVERLRVRLGHRARKQPARVRRRRAEFLLSGLLTCSGCGRPLHGRQRRGEVVYVCSGAARGKRCERGVLITEAAAVDDVVAEYLTRYGFFKVTEVIEEAPDTSALAEVEAAIRDMAAAMTAPGADVLALAATLADLHARREALAAAPQEAATRIVETGQTIAELWREADVTVRRGLLADSINSAVVLPGVRGRRVRRVDVAWRGN